MLVMRLGLKGADLEKIGKKFETFAKSCSGATESFAEPLASAYRKSRGRGSAKTASANFFLEIGIGMRLFGAGYAFGTEAS